MIPRWFWWLLAAVHGAASYHVDGHSGGPVFWYGLAMLAVVQFAPIVSREVPS